MKTRNLILILMLAAGTAFARTQKEIDEEVTAKISKEEQLLSETAQSVSATFLKVDAALEYERTMEMPVAYDRGPKIEKLEALRKALINYLVWPYSPEETN